MPFVLKAAIADMGHPIKAMAALFFEGIEGLM